MKKKIYIHIGHGKTGSTALQCFLAQNYNNLVDKDILYNNPQSIEFNNALAFKINSGNINANGNWIENEIIPIIKSNSNFKIFLFSNENLFHNLRPLFKILRSSDNAKKYEFEIILVVRNPSEMILSEYNQNVKRGGADYSFEQFLEKKNYICSHTMKASKIIKKFENLNCKYHILNYSKERYNVVRSISDILGISKFCKFENIKNKIINRSLTNKEVNIMRSINKTYGISIGSKVADRFVNEIPHTPGVDEIALDKKTIKIIRKVNLPYVRIINRRFSKDNFLNFNISYTKNNDNVDFTNHEQIINQVLQKSNVNLLNEN